MDWESRRVWVIEDVCATDREKVSRVKRNIEKLTGDLGAALVWVSRRLELLQDSPSVESFQVHYRRWGFLLLLDYCLDLRARDCPLNLC